MRVSEAPFEVSVGRSHDSFLRASGALCRDHELGVSQPADLPGFNAECEDILLVINHADDVALTIAGFADFPASILWRGLPLLPISFLTLNDPDRSSRLCACSRGRRCRRRVRC